MEPLVSKYMCFRLVETARTLQPELDEFLRQQNVSSTTFPQ